MAVPLPKLHMDVSRGDSFMAEKTTEKYDATYNFGNTTVHVVAPPPMSREKLQKRMRAFHNAGWAIIQELQQNEAEQE
ncbi:MAG TPA: hypothetical protein GXX18_06000 [Bacillales bacterium]|nr:hypothetical protein [Bacillales bacterium]